MSLFDRYGADMVCRFMGLEGAQLRGKATDGVGLRMVYRPSFHPEVCITLTGNDRRGDLELRSVRTNIWYFEMHRLDPPTRHATTLGLLGDGAWIPRGAGVKALKSLVR